MQTKDNAITGLRKTVTDLLIRAGIPAQLMPCCVAQVLFEMGGAISRVAYNNNNYSGIRYINRTTQRNASRGSAFPKSEGTFFYAHFATLKDWAADYKRVLSFGTHPPIKAVSLEDFVHRLAMNSYFAVSESRYLAGCVHYFMFSPPVVSS